MTIIDKMCELAEIEGEAIALVGAGKHNRSNITLQNETAFCVKAAEILTRTIPVGESHPKLLEVKASIEGSISKMHLLAVKEYEEQTKLLAAY